jgi:ech hydrogenase subunit D
VKDQASFLERVEQYHADGWRLALINAASILPSEEAPDGLVEITWAFARGTDFETIRETVVPGGEEVPSISAVYGAAFLYENEIRDLFGVAVTGIDLDLAGQLYKTAERIPFAPSAIRARLDKAAAAGGIRKP